MIPVLFLDTVVVSQWPCVYWFSATDQSVLVHDRGPQHGVRTGLQWQQPTWAHLNNGVQESHPHRSLPRLQVPRTIHWPTILWWSRHCTAGQEHSAQMSLLMTKRPGTSGGPSSTTGTREEYFNNMPHRLDQDPQMTRPGAWLPPSLTFVVCLRQCDESLLH